MKKFSFSYDVTLNVMSQDRACILCFDLSWYQSIKSKMISIPLELTLVNVYAFCRWGSISNWFDKWPTCSFVSLKVMSCDNDLCSQLMKAWKYWIGLLKIVTNRIFVTNQGLVYYLSRILHNPSYVTCHSRWIGRCRVMWHCLWELAL